MKFPDLVVPWPPSAPNLSSRENAPPSTGANTLTPAVSARLAELDRASHAFESILYKQMLHSMVAGSTEGGFFGKEAGGDTWEDLFESGLSDSLGSGGGLGLAKQIYRQFSEAVRRQAESSRAAEQTSNRAAGSLRRIDRDLVEERPDVGAASEAGITRTLEAGAAIPSVRTRPR